MSGSERLIVRYRALTEPLTNPYKITIHEHEYRHYSKKPTGGRYKNDSLGFIKELTEDHESVIVFLRENIKPFADEYGDAGTSDFITGLMEEHEKMAWMLRAHLK